MTCDRHDAVISIGSHLLLFCLGPTFVLCWPQMPSIVKRASLHLFFFLEQRHFLLFCFFFSPVFFRFFFTHPNETMRTTTTKQKLSVVSFLTFSGSENIYHGWSRAFIHQWSRYNPWRQCVHSAGSSSC